MKGKSYIYCLYAVLFSVFLGACSTEYDTSEGAVSGGGGVRIRIGVDNGTRAVQAGEGNESKIDTVTFFFFNDAGESILKRTFKPSDLADADAQPYWTAEDIIVFPEDDKAKISQATSLYVVTNHIPSSNTKSELEREVLGYETFPQDTNSLFVMEGHRLNGGKFDVDRVPLATLQLRRCALKLRLYLTLGEPGTGNLSNVAKWGGIPRGRRMNVPMESFIIEPSSPEALDSLERSGDSNMTRFYPDRYMPEEIAQHGGQLPYLQAYSYECDWSVNLQNELTFYINLPYYEKADSSYEILHNYYKIHIDTDRARRNTVYEVYATVKDIGSPTIDFPAILAQRSVNISDWFGDPIDVTVTNDHLALYNSHYDMYGENLAFKYRASSQPESFLAVPYLNGEGETEYTVLQESEATADLRDYSVGNGTAVLWRKGYERFGVPSPRTFNCFLRVRTIVKPVIIDQYPTSYYGRNEDGTVDYFHIITPVATTEYPIGYAIEKDADGFYKNSNQQTANGNVSPDFRIFAQDITVGGRTFSVNDRVQNPEEAVAYCKELQKATGQKWVVPTEQELKLIALACRTSKEEGVRSQLPAGQYFVARTSSYYYGNVVSIPEGDTAETGHKVGQYYIRCVLNVEK